MTLLSLHNLGKYFGGQDIFANLSLTIHEGDRIALVGANGEGKTTLLRILAAFEPPSAGRVQTAKYLKIGYLDQHASLIATNETLWELAIGAFAALREQEAELRTKEKELAGDLDPTRYAALIERYGEAQTRFELAGGYSYEQKTRQVLTGLGFSGEDYQKPLVQFSGGEQSRAQLVRLLLEQPNLLLLDEPTNHLDLTAIEWLENYLLQWVGAIVVVAHDRYFLDKLATRVWELSFGSIETFNGNFSQYSSQRAERLERKKKEYQAQQAHIAKEEEFIRRNLAGQRTKEAQGRRKRLDRQAKLDRPTGKKELILPLQTTLRSGDLVLATHNLVVGYPQDRPLFACPDLEIRRGHRVALLGPNGSGKTTFLKTVLGQVKPRAGTVRFGAGVKVGYYAQTHASLNLKGTILDEILAIRNLPIGKARNYLGRFLFSGEEVFKSIESLSGGERSRVALAKLTLTGANFLILDEPTNHLDIPSQENLEQVLRLFQGTVLMVSHDRYFVEALASHIWALEPDVQAVVVIEGGYSDYLAYGPAARSTANLDDSNGSGQPKGKLIREQTKAEKRVVEKRARELAKIERTIETVEGELAQLAQQLEQASLAQDVAQIENLGRSYQATEARLEELISQWSEMEAA
jgi:ATP-binding cassette subfamily F protein 3